MIGEEILTEIKDRLVMGFHPDKIILFGSQARKTANDKSDVDILVICPISDNRRAMMVAMDRALRGLKVSRDIVILTQEEFERDRKIPGTIARPAWLEGKILYERN